MKKILLILPLLFCLSVLNSQAMAVLEFDGKGISQVEAFKRFVGSMTCESQRLGELTE